MQKINIKPKVNLKFHWNAYIYFTFTKIECDASAGLTLLADLYGCIKVVKLVATCWVELVFGELCNEADCEWWIEVDSALRSVVNEHDQVMAKTKQPIRHSEYMELLCELFVKPHSLWLVPKRCIWTCLVCKKLS